MFYFNSRSGAIRPIQTIVHMITVKPRFAQGLSKRTGVGARSSLNIPYADGAFLDRFAIDRSVIQIGIGYDPVHSS